MSSPETTPALTHERVLAAIRKGAHTAHIASRLGMLNRRPYVLRFLKRMEVAGLVRRSERYCAPNSISWEKVA